jgi:hypothetical protein
VEHVIDSGLKANFISADDLVMAKIAAGRPQNLADAIRNAAEADGDSPPREKPGAQVE